MHLIFIRHGDPDYTIDSVTEKGKRELELLSERVKNWSVNEMFISPLGRAQVTAKACLKNLSCPSSTCEWLQEFGYNIIDPVTKEKRIAWDWIPRYYLAEKKFMNVEKWHSVKCMKEGNIPEYYKMVCEGIDNILESYDYSRLNNNKPVYNCFPHITKEQAENFGAEHLKAFQKDSHEVNLVFVCHLGVMFAIISHLTGISPVQLWQQFFVAPSSVTVVGTEERIPGEVSFRVQMMGDVSHLINGGESVSASGYFGNCLSF